MMVSKRLPALRTYLRYSTVRVHEIDSAEIFRRLWLFADKSFHAGEKPECQTLGRTAVQPSWS